MSWLKYLCILGGFLEIVDGCVFVTVSSLPERMLELNWNCRHSIDTISLYSEDHTKNRDAKPLIEISIAELTGNSYTTDITFRAEPFPGNWSRGNAEEKGRENLCLYWIKASFQGRMTDSNCFSIQPSWMYNHRSELKNLAVLSLFLPGTHNSGADKIKSARKRNTGNKFENLVLTQEENFWNQLVYGIRYFDLRIGYYPQVNDNRFWINHDFLRIQPLIPVLRDIATFLKYSPNEVIVLDFHRFPIGFDPKTATTVHNELLDLIDKELGTRVVTRPSVDEKKFTLRDVWRLEKQVIVSYNEESVVQANPWLWEGILQKWGNKQNENDLEKFLDETFSNARKGKLWAAMAELTPTSLDFFFNNNSLRAMAQRVNRLLSVWFADEKKNWTSNANIVATDFFLGNNLIEIAINENLKRSRK